MQRIIITGGSGYIGRKIIGVLKDSYEIVILSRRPEKHHLDGAKVVAWDGKTANGWGNLADGAFAIINLAGANIGAWLWTKSYKTQITESRINAGHAVVEAIRAARTKPKALVQASGVGYYGHAPDPVTEHSNGGSDFLAKVCREWEKSTAEVEAMGVRRVVTRFAVVIDPKEGALRRMLLPFYLFVGGPVGGGKQPFPWIHPVDITGAIRYLLENEQISGVFNLVAPRVVTNGEFARALGKAVSRPSFMPTPGLALKLGLGEMSSLVLQGQNAKSDKLRDAGYTFKFEDAESALADLMR